MVKWEELPNGYQAKLAEGALTLLVFYDGRWRVCINDRLVRHPYDSEEEAKRAAISWARGKLELMSAELFQLEHPPRKS